MEKDKIEIESEIDKNNDEITKNKQEREYEKACNQVSDIRDERKKYDKKQYHLDKMKKEIKQEIDALSAKVIDMKEVLLNDKLDITKYERENNVDKKSIEELMRNRDNVQKKVISADEENKKQSNSIQMHNNSMLKLKNEINGYKYEGTKCAKHIYQLEKDKEKYAN